MAEREPNQAEAGRDSTLRAAQAIALVVGVGICLALSVAFAVPLLGRSDGALTVDSGERVNPNDAPVASLMRLPQIGVARARAIIAHRERVGSQAGHPPAFREADDLQEIKGIGPAIVEDLRPWLQFDRPSNDSNAPPGR